MFRVSVAVLMLFGVSGAQFGQPHVSLRSVKKIHVGAMGQSDEADRFRMLLEEELGKAGFLVTDEDKSADAILTGALSVRVYADTSRARVTVILKTPTGERLWGRDFQPHFKFGGTNDTVKLRAHDIAKALKKDVEQASRNGGKA